MELSLQFLKEVFPSKSEEQIQNIMVIVEQENPSDSPEQKMENIYNMLSGDEDEGAVGYGHQNPMINAYFEQLQEVFPDAKEEFLWDFCRKQRNDFNFEDAIDIITREGYDKKDVDIQTVWETLKGALPGADPSYLKKQAQKLAYEDQIKLQEFVNAALENNNYPTLEEYLKNKQQEDVLSIYKPDYPLNCFLEKFQEMFPDPEQHFRDPNRQNPLEQAGVSEDDLLYAKTFLYNMYPDIRKRHIDLVFRMKKRRLVECCELLNVIKRGLKTRRTPEPVPDCQNLALLQEVSYLKHKRVIRRLIKYKNEVYQQFKEQARNLGLLETCGVCEEEELIPEECFNCKKGCVFCKDCVRRYIEVRMGDGLTTFPCCNECDSAFDLHIIQLALPQNTFGRLVLKIQSDEIKQANVDGLETCPFCEFASIPPEESKIFKCENPDCLKESCRDCRHESHIPKRCEEIEYDEDVRNRTYIENMMTEALARKCYKCNKRFIKSAGCNKMTCTCGAFMCYLCSQPIKGYDHFGDYKPCKLFTNDAEIDLDRVRRRAEMAKKDLGNVKIKFDPTKNLDNFFPAHYQN